jgi:hypothetical protein
VYTSSIATISCVDVEILVLLVDPPASKDGEYENMSRQFGEKVYCCLGPS